MTRLLESSLIAVMRPLWENPISLYRLSPLVMSLVFGVLTNFPAWAVSNWGFYGDDSPDFFEARSLIAKKLWAEAVSPLKAALKNEPHFSLAALDLSKALLYSGHRDEALSVLVQQIQREKGERKAFFIQRLRVMSRSFRDHRVFQLYQDGLDLLEGKKIRAAREKFLRANEQDPNHVEVLLRLGQVYLLDGDLDLANEKLKSAIRLNPFEPEIGLWLGRALHRRGELNEGLEEIKKAATELMRSETAAIWYAEALVSVGQRRLAIKALEEDLARQPFHVQGLIALAKTRLLSSRPDTQILWSARKELQLALSRVDQYAGPDELRFEGELGVEFIRSVGEIREEIEKTLKQVESKIKAKDSEEPEGSES